MDCRNGTHRAQRDRVFAAEQERAFAVRKQPFRSAFHLRERGSRVAYANIYVADVANAYVGKVFIEVRTVRFQPERLAAERVGTETRTRAERRRTVERRAVEYGTRGFIIVVAAYKGVNLHVRHC